MTVRATNFYGMARDNFASVRYCVVSSLGKAPVGNNLSMELSPRRVIDPLLWVITNPRKEGVFDQILDEFSHLGTDLGGHLQP
jgi:hypothetical protein